MFKKKKKKKPKGGRGERAGGVSCFVGYEIESNLIWRCSHIRDKTNLVHQQVSCHLQWVLLDYPPGHTCSQPESLEHYPRSKS